MSHAATMDETRDHAGESEEEEDCFEPIEKRKIFLENVSLAFSENDAKSLNAFDC